MLRYLFAVLFVLVSGINALAQQPQKPFTLTLPPSDVQVIWDQMGELPWKKVNPLMQNLQRQIQEQMAADQQAPLPTPAPVPKEP